MLRSAWDGADLALLREALTAIIERDGFRTVGVDLQSVKYIPSGFFGMLFEWHEQSIQIRLDNPQLNVEQMLWFRMFFVKSDDGSFYLNDERTRNNTPNEQIEVHRLNFNHDDEFDDDPAESQRLMEEHLKSIKFGLPYWPRS